MPSGRSRWPPAERRHFIGFDGKNYWKYRRSAQGSRNGPLSWAGPSSLLIRCTQGVFTGMSPDKTKPEARIQLYVDDPAIAVRGTKQERDEIIAITVLIWLILGFKLAFPKAQRGTDLIWIGGQIQITHEAVIVSIPPGESKRIFGAWWKRSQRPTLLRFVKSARWPAKQINRINGLRVAPVPVGTLGRAARRREPGESFHLRHRMSVGKTNHACPHLV